MSKLHLWKFREKLIQGKDYLRSIHKSESKLQTSLILKKSSKNELRLLLKVLYLITQKEIRAHKELQKKKNNIKIKAVIFQNFATKSKLRKLERSSKLHIVNVLLQLKSILPLALFYLFN